MDGDVGAVRWGKGVNAIDLVGRSRAYECPYCLEPVGIVGNWFAKLFGTRIHGCDMSNTVAFNHRAAARVTRAGVGHGQ